MGFTNALKNNTQKPKFSIGNLNTKNHININNDYNEKKEDKEIANPINKEQ